MLQEILGDYCVVESNDEGELVIRTSTGAVLVVREEMPVGGSPLVVVEEPTKN
jgi:hypothetical protein